ncbi:hypothetical protein [Oceanidesulfovibrio marinus]|uniref:Uncharacterized protein n=1 Tax=Oceanidesulfovibrio marinus TaxID=370038 RepID=A0A6P1ZQ87_9BACT|nr:hypothetical protein [Oceanidesulfovibrio marinus]TVM36685.1 hypothetical protein DQK91_01830 [Oceanidesulfovibrio marinus]
MNEPYSRLLAGAAGRTAALEHETVFYPFGIPVAVASNAESVLEAAEDALGRWKSMPTSYRESDLPRRLEIVVLKGMKGCSPARIIWRGRDGLLTAAAPGLLATAAGTSGAVFASPAWADLGRTFADLVVVPLAVSLAAESLSEERLFLRASAFVHGNAAMLLLAPARADMARLDLAGRLHRAGMEMLAADFLLAAHHPVRGLELWGHPAAIPPAPDMIPEEIIMPPEKPSASSSGSAKSAGAAKSTEDEATPGPAPKESVTTWTPLPLEGGVKVHLQHSGPVLIAMLDSAAPGPEEDAFPAPLGMDRAAVELLFTKRAAVHYPPPRDADPAQLPTRARAILAALSRNEAVRVPAGDPESMATKLLKKLEAMTRHK